MLAAIGVGFMLTVVGFKVVVPDDPYAMLDDTYLSTLKGDDEVANEAARKVCLLLFCFALGLFASNRRPGCLGNYDGGGGGLLVLSS